MEDIVYYFLIFMAEAIIMWLYCHHFFTVKYPVINQIAVYSIGYTVLLCLSLFNIPWINGIAFVVINYIILIILYDINISLAFFHSLILTVTMALSEALIITMLPHLVVKNFREIETINDSGIINVILSKLVYLFITQVICHFFHKQKSNTIKTSGIYYLSVIPPFSVFIAITLVSICFNTELPSSFSNAVIISLVLLLLINIFVFCIEQFSQKKNFEYVQIHSQMQKEYDSVQYYKMLAEQNENNQIMIHDIKNHFNTLMLIAQQDGSDKVQSYISTILNDNVFRNSYRICDNNIVNSILSRYIKNCSDNHIVFNTDIRSKTLDFMCDNDITSLLCNLLDNSYTAAKNIPDACISLTVTTIESSDSTLITLVNSCRINPFDNYGNLPSTKKDKIHHGYGIKSIKHVVDKYNGELKQYYNEDAYEFHTIILLPRINA